MPMGLSATVRRAGRGHFSFSYLHRGILALPSENSTDRKQRELRDRLWPEAASWIWDRNDKKNKGFATIPRLLPLIMILVKVLAAKGEGDARLAYLELWSRARDNHIISITDEADIAYASNCINQKRSSRTWADHMRVLERLGFILIAPDGVRAIAHILLLNPLAVAARLQKEQKTPAGWWSVFTRRAAEVGAKIPAPATMPPVPVPGT